MQPLEPSGLIPAPARVDQMDHLDFINPLVFGVSFGTRRSWALPCLSGKIKLVHVQVVGESVSSKF